MKSHMQMHINRIRSASLVNPFHANLHLIQQQTPQTRTRKCSGA